MDLFLLIMGFMLMLYLSDIRRLMAFVRQDHHVVKARVMLIMNQSALTAWMYFKEVLGRKFLD